MPIFEALEICAKQTVPPGNIETIVTIRFLWNNGMVDPVHIRCDDKPAQYTINPRRYINITMTEHGHHT